jgi:catechol 2,3-dioxygenase-like lactoylglutathione lyase family enzyme
MTVTVRYIVNDVDAAIAFYVDALGFTLDLHPAPGFAALSKDGLRLLLNRPGAGGAGQSMTDGSAPAPGGWNLASSVAKLKSADHKFRGDIIQGNGGKQALVNDPSGNPIELFEPMKKPD